MFSKIGWAIDSTIMYGANKAVHAWNWTTGGTKAGLANLVSDAATITMCSNILIEGCVDDKTIFYFGPFLTIAYLIMGHNNSKHNKKIEGLEKKAREKEAMSLEAECMKKEEKHRGNMNLMLSGIGLIGQEKGEFPFFSYFTGSYLMYGTSNHIMRADYLPPRKDCICPVKSGCMV